MINESEIYSPILSSKFPHAREFKRWVTAEVLPQINNTGHYISYTLPRILAREYILFISTTKDK